MWASTRTGRACSMLASAKVQYPTDIPLHHVAQEGDGRNEVGMRIFGAGDEGEFMFWRMIDKGGLPSILNQS